MREDLWKVFDDYVNVFQDTRRYRDTPINRDEVMAHAELELDVKLTEEESEFLSVKIVEFLDTDPGAEMEFYRRLHQDLKNPTTGLLDNTQCH